MKLNPITRNEIVDCMKDNAVESQLLLKYFSGQTTLLEQEEIEQWLSKDNNFEIFFEVLVSWEKSNVQYVADTQAGFDKFKSKIQTLNAGEFSNSGRERSFSILSKWWLSIACFGLIVVLGFVFQHSILYKTVNTSYAETKTILLDDNSSVILNANSSIEIPRFGKFMQNREVWIKGEAFFKVQKNPVQQKFIVHTEHLDVEVVGTRFNVNARHQKTKVVLEAGKVRVVSNRDSHETLALLDKSGDFIETNGKRTDVITGQVDHSLYTAWQDRKLKFDNAPLQEVLKMIDEFYGVSILCEDATILEKHFTGTLPNDNLDIVLRSLSNIYNATFSADQSVQQKTK